MSLYSGARRKAKAAGWKRERAKDGLCRDGAIAQLAHDLVVAVHARVEQRVPAAAAEVVDVGAGLEHRHHRRVVAELRGVLHRREAGARARVDGGGRLHGRGDGETGGDGEEMGRDGEEMGKRWEMSDEREMRGEKRCEERRDEMRDERRDERREERRGERRGEGHNHLHEPPRRGRVAEAARKRQRGEAALRLVRLELRRDLADRDVHRRPPDEWSRVAKNGVLGAAWLQGHGSFKGSDVLGASSRVGRAIPSLETNPE